jgi:uncharacterized protein (TIGR00251 family)
MHDLKITEKTDGVTFAVRVLPRSSRNEIVGEAEGVLKIKLTAPPVEGAANKALIEFLSGKLKVAKSRISIITGQSGRSKVVAIEGITREDLINMI